jgi:acetylornithine deacetylase
MVKIAEAARLHDRRVASDTTSRDSNLDLIRDMDAWLAAHGIASRVRHAGALAV